MAAGFLAGMKIASRCALNAGLNPDHIANLMIWLLIGGILGSRVWYVATFWKTEFAGQPLSKIFLQRAGFVFHGGLIGAAIVIALFLRINKLPMWKTADTLAPGIALGHAFGRVGCLMTGCCYGAPTASPIGILFTDPRSPATDHCSRVGPVHPVQIYEAAVNFALSATLFWLFGKRKFDGQIFSIYLIAYGCFRFLIEHFRGDGAAKAASALTSAQLISVILIAVGGVILFSNWTKAKATPKQP